MKAIDREIDAIVRLVEQAGGRVLSTRFAEPAPGPGPGRHEFTVVGWRPATANQLMSSNWQAAARRKAGDREAVKAYSWHVPRATRRRRVSVEVTMAGRMRLVDPDACLKSLHDALVAAGLLVDDSARWVEIGPFIQIRGDLRATKIILEDLE